MNDTKTGSDTTGDQPEPDPPIPTKPEHKTNPAAPSDEIGGPQGPEPTRFGDWERKGRCIDF